MQARIAEERALAEASPGDPCWHPQSVAFMAGVVDTVAAHIACQDPAATLARLDALTALLDLHMPRADLDGTVCAECSYPGQITGDSEGDWPCSSLRRLAAIWRDRTDYRAEWVA